MSTLFWALCAVLISLIALAALALRDPKRLRVDARMGAAPRRALKNSQRQWLGSASLLPGIALAMLGQWPAFLIWLGATTAGGWALAQSLSPRPR